MIQVGATTTVRCRALSLRRNACTGAARRTGWVNTVHEIALAPARSYASGVLMRVRVLVGWRLRWGEVLAWTFGDTLEVGGPRFGSLGLGKRFCIIYHRGRNGDGVAGAVVVDEGFHVLLGLELLEREADALTRLQYPGERILGSSTTLRTSSSETQTVEMMLAYAHMLSFMNSMRSSSRSWQRSQKSFQSCSHLAVVSCRMRVNLWKSASFAPMVCCARSSLVCIFSSSLPCRRVDWAVYELMRTQSDSYFSFARVACDSCCCFNLNSRSMAAWYVFLWCSCRLRSALAGASKSFLICWETFRWKLACFSVSERSVSREVRSSLRRRYSTDAFLGETCTTYPISSLPSAAFASAAKRFAYCSSSIALGYSSSRNVDAGVGHNDGGAYLSFQKFLSSSIVRIAPLILAKSTSTPASCDPQNALQKSSERSP